MQDLTFSVIPTRTFHRFVWFSLTYKYYCEGVLEKHILHVLSYAPSDRKARGNDDVIFFLVIMCSCSIMFINIDDERLSVDKLISGLLVVPLWAAVVSFQNLISSVSECKTDMVSTLGYIGVNQWAVVQKFAVTVLQRHHVISQIQ